MRFSLLFIVVHCFLMGLCIDGPCWSGGPLGLVGLLVWWALGLVGPWVWWARGSGGHVYLVGPWVNFKGSDMPRCPWSSSQFYIAFYAEFAQFTQVKFQTMFYFPEAKGK